jgi:predicted DNA-binding transcriptional regulator YafY
MVPGDRLIMLYQLLTLHGRRHYLADLATQLGRSPQAINRMVDVIEAHVGKDAYIERGMEGRRRYFRYRTRSEERALGYSFEELHFLATCRDLAAPHLPGEVVGRIDRTLTSLAVQLGDSGRQKIGVPIGFRSKGSIDYGAHLDTVSGIREAISRRLVCTVSYRRTGGRELRAYRYAPGGIVAMSGTLYVQGRQLDDGSLLPGRQTTFSLHRIASVIPTGEHFAFNAVEGDAKPFGLGWHEPRRVTVKVQSAAADYVRDRVWSDDQAITELADGSLEITMTTTSEKEVSAWVMSFGGLADIVGWQLQLGATGPCELSSIRLPGCTPSTDAQP